MDTPLFPKRNKEIEKTTVIIEWNKNKTYGPLGAQVSSSDILIQSLISSSTFLAEWFFSFSPVHFDSSKPMAA